MKYFMRNIFLFLSAFLIVFCIEAAANKSSEAADLIPAIEQTKYIRLYPGNGWMFRVTSNGSGSIRYGSNPMDFASFPEGTVNFTNLYESLITDLKDSCEQTKNKVSIAVIFGEEGKSSLKAKYYEDSTLWNSLIESIRDKWIPIQVDRFSHLLETRSILIKSNRIK